MPTPPKTTTPPSRTIVLKLSTTLLLRFPHDSPAVDEKDVKIKDASSPPSSTSGEAGLQASSFDAASDAASTPAPAATTEGGKAKKSNGAGSARGTKRALDKTGDAPKPPRSRPSAAKKRLKL
jgi:activator of HSP90 ATPase